MRRSLLVSSLFSLVLVAPAAIAADGPVIPTLAVSGIAGGLQAEVATALLVQAAGELKGLQLVSPRLALAGKAPAGSWVLGGELKPAAGGKWTMAMTLTGPDATKQTWDWSGGDPVAGVSNACLRLTGAFKLSPKPEDWRRIGDVLRPAKSRTAWELELAGEQAYWAGKWRVAAERFAKAAGDPAHGSALVRVARTYRTAADQGRWQPAFFRAAGEASAFGRQALEAAELAARRVPQAAGAWAELALARAFAGGTVKEALQALAEAERLGADLPTVKAAAALIRDDETAWRRAIEAPGQEASILVLAGARAAARGEGETALTLYGRALDLEPGMPAAVFGQARILADLKRFAEAQGKADQLVAVEPAVGQWLKGVLHLQVGEPARAQAAFDAALAAEPRSAALTYYQGRCQLARGEVDHALEALRGALYLDPKHAPSHMLLGVIYQERLKQDRLARFHLQQAAELMPALAPAARTRLATLGS